MVKEEDEACMGERRSVRSVRMKEPVALSGVAPVSQPRDHHQRHLRLRRTADKEIACVRACVCARSLRRGALCLGMGVCGRPCCSHVLDSTPRASTSD